mmetsp:Transcript_333/g.292  ORF Transcript_333/g.292 Transcript_333/m.292 type:complete len:239 (-) Transcript_333:751-1467(-)
MIIAQVIRIADPTPLDRLHVIPLGFVQIGSEIPEVKPVPNAGKGVDFFAGQESHDLVSRITVFESLGRSVAPIVAGLGFSIGFFGPVAVHRAQTEGWTRFASSKGTQFGLTGIDRSTRLIIPHVRHTPTFHIFTRHHGIPTIIIIKPIQPHGTIIRRQTPFPHDNRPERHLHGPNPVPRAASPLVKGGFGTGPIPRLVDMGVEGSIGAPGHEASPDIHVESEGIVHYEAPVGSGLFYY